MRTLFSTDGIHPRNSFRRWSELIFERIVPVELSKVGNQTFQGRLEIADVGPLLLTRVSQSAMRTEATAGTIRSHDKQETVTVSIVLSGIVANAQGDREALQREGEIVLLDRRPTVMSTNGESQTLLLEVPRARLEGMLGSVHNYSALTIGASQASTSLVTTFFGELTRIHPQLDADTSSRMAGIGLDLIAACFAERLARDVPKPLHGTLLVQRARAYIEANLADTTLDPPGLALVLGISVRRLQELFQERGRHVSDWIWKRRLEVAAVRLADPGYGHLSIGVLSYGCGFSSQAHFSRRFKQRYSTTPSEFRHMARMKML